MFYVSIITCVFRVYGNDPLFKLCCIYISLPSLIYAPSLAQRSCLNPNLKTQNINETLLQIENDYFL